MVVFAVASFTIVIYDWGLTFGQEGHFSTDQQHAAYLPSISLTDTDCRVFYYVTNWTTVIVNVMLGVIMITWLHAMYQRSKKMLVFLVVIFLAIQVTAIGVVLVGSRNVSGVEFQFVLPVTHMCGYVEGEDIVLLTMMTWILNTVWAILGLCLAVWIAVKHFLGLRRVSTTWVVQWDYFTISIVRTHVFFFAGVFLQLSTFWNTSSFGSASATFDEVLGIVTIVQMFMLGPRFILSAREYHARLVANSDGGTGMTSIVFEERIHISTSSIGKSTLLITSLIPQFIPLRAIGIKNSSLHAMLSSAELLKYGEIDTRIELSWPDIQVRHDCKPTCLQMLKGTVRAAGERGLGTVGVVVTDADNSHEHGQIVIERS
ncbi:hypothetical protein K503DRAFT_781520 [Rhizopogon vinicolor AM-OR11-026]|uniref:Uncharacterized protein n=1 Tax=Rhizopogon vinicolor AM-OR11-026 TaxID=1314800 RepID=A0A1B7N615_9AGAM|nr:hypothetical protein K503DRAFT_781520 [Rhizopogon vinicolor AM-OR11-026]